MKKYIAIILCIITLISISKHNDYTDITAMAFINSMGIDYHLEENEYEVYFYVLNNFSMGQPEGGSQTDTNAYIGKATGKSITEAMNKLRENSNIFFEFGVLRSVILHERFFYGNNAFDLYAYIKDSNKIYPSFDVFTTSDDLNDIFNIKNFSETSAYYTILTDTTGSNTAQRVSFVEFMNNIINPDFTVPYPMLKVTKDMYQNQDKPYTTLSVAGYSFITKDLLLTSFQHKNFPGLRWFNKLSGTVQQFEKEKQLDVNVKSYSIKTKIKKGTCKITIHLDCILTFFPDISSQKEVDKLISDVITDELNQIKQEMDAQGIDFFNIDFLSNGKADFRNTPLEIKVFVKKN